MADLGGLNGSVRRLGGNNSSSGGFRWLRDTISPALAQFDNQVDVALVQVMNFHQKSLEATMKKNAKWTDRTSNARNGLTARVTHKPRTTYQITAAHGVPYGIWLETRWSGRYAIIIPSLEAEFPKIMATVGKLFSMLDQKWSAR